MAYNNIMVSIMDHLKRVELPTLHKNQIKYIQAYIDDLADQLGL